MTGTTIAALVADSSDDECETLGQIFDVYAEFGSDNLSVPPAHVAMMASYWTAMAAAVRDRGSAMVVADIETQVPWQDGIRLIIARVSMNFTGSGWQKVQPVAIPAPSLWLCAFWERLLLAFCAEAPGHESGFTIPPPGYER